MPTVKNGRTTNTNLALYFLYYNFCRVHVTLKTTPAVKARGLTDMIWSVERLL